MNIQTSNFGAGTVKSPVVFQTITKSGTRDFHGQGSYTVRDSSLNSNDASIAKPDTRYQYSGVNVGGPVIIPGTSFNHDRNKLVFFGGFEWQLQRGAEAAA